MVPGGGDLVPTISLFRLQVNETNDKMSFKMGVKFAVPVYMGRVFQKYCFK